MDEIALVFDPLPSPDLVRLVEENVITHTILVTGTLEWSPVNYFLKSASSAVRNTTPRAMSAAWPSRPRGMRAMIFSSTSGGTARTISVST